MSTYIITGKKHWAELWASGTLDEKQNAADWEVLGKYSFLDRMSYWHNLYNETVRKLSREIEEQKEARREYYKDLAEWGINKINNDTDSNK